MYSITDRSWLSADGVIVGILRYHAGTNGDDTIIKRISLYNRSYCSYYVVLQNNKFDINFIKPKSTYRLLLALARSSSWRRVWEVKLLALPKDVQ